MCFGYLNHHFVTAVKVAWKLISDVCEHMNYWKRVFSNCFDVLNQKTKSFLLLVEWLFPESTIKCYCDNSGVVNTITNLHNSTILHPNDTMNDDHDDYLAINETISDCAPITLQFIHVKGHQDSKSNQPLTVIEQFNIECNKYAKQFVTTSMTPSTLFGNPEILAAKPHLLIAGKIICCEFIPRLCQKMFMPAYHLYLKKRFICMTSMVAQIHWTILQHSLDKFNANDQWCLVLFINEKLPLWASKAHPHNGSLLCPSCQWEQWTPRHILVCKHQERKILFTNLKANLTAAAQKLSLHPCILTAIWLGLTTVHTDSPYPDISHKLPIPLWSPIQCQSKLGWTQLYQGCILRCWVQTIDEIHPELALSSEQVMTQLLCIL